MTEAETFPCQGHYHYTDLAREICIHGMFNWTATNAALKVGDGVIMENYSGSGRRIRAPIDKEGEVVYIDTNWRHTRYCVAFKDFDGDMKMPSPDHVLTPDGNGWWCGREELRKLPWRRL